MMTGKSSNLKKIFSAWKKEIQKYEKKSNGIEER
jgi:hypothetical protein